MSFCVSGGSARIEINDMASSIHRNVVLCTQDCLIPATHDRNKDEYKGSAS